MTDYNLGYKVGDVATALRELARSQEKVAQAMVVANTMELAKQRREWLASGHSKDTF